jgi:hypothetical protein
MTRGNQSYGSGNRAARSFSLSLFLSVLMETREVRSLDLRVRGRGTCREVRYADLRVRAKS